jgi:hypothetical protein
MHHQVVVGFASKNGKHSSTPATASLQRRFARNTTNALHQQTSARGGEMGVCVTAWIACRERVLHEALQDGNDVELHDVPVEQSNHVG